MTRFDQDGKGLIHLVLDGEDKQFLARLDETDREMGIQIGKGDKLLVLQIDLGTEKRQICAGLRQHYQPEELVGKQIVVVANLAPRQMRGEVSNGMLLAATDSPTGKVIIVTPAAPAAPGSKVS